MRVLRLGKGWPVLNLVLKAVPFVERDPNGLSIISLASVKLWNKVVCFYWIQEFGCLNVFLLEFKDLVFRRRCQSSHQINTSLLQRPVPLNDKRVKICFS